MAISPETRPPQTFETKEQLLEAIEFSAQFQQNLAEARARLVGLPGTISPGKVEILLVDLLINPSEAPRVSPGQRGIGKTQWATP